LIADILNQTGPETVCMCQFVYVEGTKCHHKNSKSWIPVEYGV